MTSRHSVLIAGAPAPLRVVHADRLMRGSDGVPVAPSQTRTKAAFRRRFRLSDQGQSHHESNIRLEERGKERMRIVHELHDTLLQGFLGASMVLDQAVEQTPADSPTKPALSRALGLVRRAIDEGRAAMRGLSTASPAPSSLEQAFSTLLDEVTPSRGIQLRIIVQGRAQALNPAIQDQILLIGREAVMNALRHSKATEIEVEVQHMPQVLRVLVRDNGCGIDRGAVQKAGDSHWGLRGMRDRAENIGARFAIWSRLGAGTEVRVAVALGRGENDNASLRSLRMEEREYGPAVQRSSRLNVGYRQVYRNRFPRPVTEMRCNPPRNGDSTTCQSESNPDRNATLASCQTEEKLSAQPES